MYGFSQPIMPNEMHWNRYRPPHNPQWRPFHGPRAQIPYFRPRNQGFYNQRPQIQSSSEEYWCETCDRGFHTEDLLSKHKQQHQKCNIDGCQFIAHPKVITKHIQMQHSSGLYKKIAKLNNPEEIEKWKEERRKWYPTKSTIDKKAAELKEKIDRGETIGLERRDWRGQEGSKLNGDHKRKLVPGQGIKRRINDENNQPGTKFRKPNNRKPRKPPNTLPEPENNRNLVPFTGIQSIEMDIDEIEEDLHSNDLIEDEDVETFNPGPATAAKVGDILNVMPVVCGALSSLICEYGSSDEDIESTSNTVDKLGTTNGYCEKDKIFSTAFLSNKETVNCQNYSSNKNFKQNTPQKTSDPNKIEKSSFDGNNIKQDKNDAVSNAENHSENIPQNLCIKNPDLSNSGKSHELSEKDSISDVTKKDVNIKYNDDDDSGPEEVKVDRNMQSANNDSQNCNYENKTKLPIRRVGVMRKQPCYKKPKPKLPSTLIYRLLSKEMKQERNKVLQCIRYIRKNNYFDKETK